MRLACQRVGSWPLWTTRIVTPISLTLPRSSKSQRVTLSVLPGRTSTPIWRTVFGSRTRTGQILRLIQISWVGPPRYVALKSVPPEAGATCCLPPVSAAPTSCKSSSPPTTRWRTLAGDWSGVKSTMTVRIIIKVKKQLNSTAIMQI